jgi:hypothetical protein
MSRNGKPAKAPSRNMSALQQLQREITFDALLHEWELAVRRDHTDLSQTTGWAPVLAQIRISRADTKYAGASASPKRQLRRIAEYCACYGFTPVELCFEAQSGHLTDKYPRKLFEQFRLRIESGELQARAVVTYNINRFTRDRLIGEQWLHTLKHVDMDLHEADRDEPPRPLAKKESDYADKFKRAWNESREISERVLASKHEMHKDGRLLTGVDFFGHRPEWEMVGGHRKQVRGIVFDAEAAWLREATARLGSGEPLHSIVTDFNARGYKGRKGGRCGDRQLREFLVSPRMIGQQMLGGVPVNAPIEPILTEAELERNCALLEQRRRNPSRAYPLSGMAMCGSCGAHMTGHSNQQRTSYRCAQPQLRGRRRCSCGQPRGHCRCAGNPVAADGKRHVTRDRAFVERFAVEIALAALDTQAIADSAATSYTAASVDDQRDALEEKLRTLGESRRILARQEREGVLTQQEAAEELQAVLRESEEVRQRLSSMRTATTDPVLALEQSDLRRRLQEEGPHFVRRVVSSVIDHLVVHSAPPGHPYAGIEVVFVPGYSVPPAALEGLREELAQEYAREKRLTGRRGMTTKEDEDTAFILWQQGKTTSEIRRAFEAMERPTPQGGKRWQRTTIEQAVERAHERRGLIYEPRPDTHSRYSSEARNVVYELASSGRPWPDVVGDLRQLGIPTWDGKPWRVPSAQQCYRVECARRGTKPQGRRHHLPESLRRRIWAMVREDGKSPAEVSKWLNDNGVRRRSGKQWNRPAVSDLVRDADSLCGPPQER